MNPSSTYLLEVSEYLRDAQSSEMSYRAAFQNYLATIFPKEEKYFIQHDPKATAGNKPDFIVLKNNVPLLYIEVKKVGEDLNKIEKSSQATRYYGYTNLIISDYLEFRFFRNGQRYGEAITLARPDVKAGILTHISQNASELLAGTMRDFIFSQKEPIRKGEHLAKIMGGRGRRIRENVLAFLALESVDTDELAGMMRYIRENLIESFSNEDFADMYAQTLIYGLFAARYNDTTLETFSRAEARDLIPKSNPFLQKFFDHISGSSFPRRLEIIVNELCEVFTHADVKALMQEYFKSNDLFGKTYEAPDPVIHFYEDFLREYDEQKKMEMGVFYTPLPVVRFIIRGIDELLKREFDIPRGLADNSRISKMVEIANKKGIMKKVEDTSLHRVQLLDFAVGTGTFLNEAVLHIRDAFAGNEGRWEQYVEDDLLPRLHGFELMMASYTVAHLKLGMTLERTGIDHFGKRVGIYLTNTLDTPHDVPLQNNLFGVVESIAEESRKASQVKRDHPIMVVMGNPPYSGISQNKHYTENNAYKVEPGGKQKLNERKHWLDDDYVKFIRFAESMIEKNGEGVVGMITAHGYIDNPTFRGMRWHLRKTFDAIYVLDLHGNSNKKETAPGGGKDENVFDIKTGVAVIFGVKKKGITKGEKPLATVYSADLYGTRNAKFEALDDFSLESVAWSELPQDAEIWKVEGKGRPDYEKGFSVAELFPKNTTGIVTMGDGFIVDESKKVLEARVDDFLENDVPEQVLKEKYGLGKNYAKWIIENKAHIENDTSKVVPLAYRPFDIRYTYFDNKLVWRPRTETMKHFLAGENVGLVFARSQKNPNWDALFISKTITETKLGEASTQSAVAPLYLYTDSGEKVPNLNKEIVSAIESAVGTTAPEDILDYVYASLHSPSYRETYKEFLKSDFPRVPYPSDTDTFWKLVAFGKKLRGLHLLEDPIVHTPITSFPISGSNVVEKIVYKNGRVYINAEQYFDHVPEAVWNFYIGGYQPAQKYLKDRKGRSLTTAEFENYERMTVALNETMHTMEKIDSVRVI